MPVSPNIFIGSSSEGSTVADLLTIDLAHTGNPKPWYQGVFGLGETAIESLIQELSQSDFAVLILTKDDLAEYRGEKVSLPRDNVLFELGLRVRWSFCASARRASATEKCEVFKDFQISLPLR